MFDNGYDRDAMLRILSTVGDEKLQAALSAIGITVSPGEQFPEDGMTRDGELTPWNKTEVKVPLTVRRPIVDISRTLEVPAMTMRRVGMAGNAMIAPMDLAPYAASAAE